MRLSRRSFLIASASQVGAWLVEPSVARQILAAAESDARFLAVPIERAKRTLYYDLEWGRFSLDGPCLSDPDPLALREFLGLAAVDTDSSDEIGEFLLDRGLMEADEDPSAALAALGGLDSLLTDESPLYAALAEEIQSHWYNVRCPEAAAHHYLSELGLADPRGESARGLGTLEFWDGGSLGNDGVWVETGEIVVVSGLQQRLIQLGENTEVRVCRSVS